MENIKTEEFTKALLAPHLVTKGYGNPLVDGGAPMIGFQGRTSISTNAATKAVVVQYDPQASAISGQIQALAYECTSEGVMNMAAPVHRIAVGPRLNELFSSVGVMGASLSVANTSANDDRHGSFTAAVIEDSDNERYPSITGSRLANLAGDNILMGYVGSDGVVVQCPTSHVGMQQMAVHDDFGSTVGAIANEVYMGSMATRTISDTKSNFTGATGAFASSISLPVNSIRDLWDSDLLVSGDSAYQKFVFPNNCYAITLNGTMDFTAGVEPITEVRGHLSLFDDSGDVIYASGAGGFAFRTLGGSVDIPVGESQSYTMNGRTIKTDRPIKRAVIQGIALATAGGLWTNYNLTVNLGLHTLQPTYNARDAIVLVTGLRGNDSIAISATASVAARMNSSQALTVSTKKYAYDHSELSALMHTTVYNMLARPVSLGQNYPALAAAVTHEMILAMEGDASGDASVTEDDRAFGFKKFRHMGKKLLRAAEKAAEIGGALGVPGAELAGKALTSVDEAIRVGRQAHEATKSISSGDARKIAKHAAGLLL